MLQRALLFHIAKPFILRKYNTQYQDIGYWGRETGSFFLRPAHTDAHLKTRDREAGLFFFEKVHGAHYVHTKMKRANRVG